MSEQVKLALIGCGGIAGAHMSGYQKLHEAGYDAFRLAAVCDTDGKKAAAMAEQAGKVLGHAPEVFTDLGALLKAVKLDGADICTPHAFHHTTAIPCLKRGLHVMVEKPCGITMKAGERILAAAEKAGRTVAVAEQVRRHLGARTIEWVVNKKKLLGTPRFFSMEVIKKTELPWKSYAFAWRGLKLLTGGGMLLDAGAHFADMMLHVFGPVEQVFCDMRTYFTPKIDGPGGVGRRPLDIEDTWLGTLQFQSGLMGHWSWSREATGYEVNSRAYYGSKGALLDRQQWMHPFQFGADFKPAEGDEVCYEELERQYQASLSPKQQARLFPLGVTDGIALECWDFVEAIAKDRAPEVDGAQGQQVKALCYAFYESAHARRAVTPAEVLAGKAKAYQQPINEYWKI